MASLIDSEAHFTSRAEEYGVPDAVIQNLKNNQVATLGTLAFAINRPGTEFNERDFDTWATNINQGQALAVGTLAALRRLHFEAEVVVTSSFRASVRPSNTKASSPCRAYCQDGCDQKQAWWFAYLWSNGTFPSSFGWSMPSIWDPAAQAYWGQQVHFEGKWSLSRTSWKTCQAGWEHVAN